VHLYSCESLSVVEIIADSYCHHLAQISDCLRIILLKLARLGAVAVECRFGSRGAALGPTHAVEQESCALVERRCDHNGAAGQTGGQTYTANQLPPSLSSIIPRYSVILTLFDAIRHSHCIRRHTHTLRGTESRSGSHRALSVLAPRH
jgi:hypothetical protein